MRRLSNLRNLHQFPTWLENQKAKQLIIAQASGQEKIEEEGFKVLIQDNDDYYCGVVTNLQRRNLDKYFEKLPNLGTFG